MKLTLDTALVLAVMCAALFKGLQAQPVESAGCEPTPAGYVFLQGLDTESGNLVCLRKRIALTYSLQKLADACDSAGCYAFQVDCFGACIKDASFPFVMFWPGMQCYGYYARIGFPMPAWPPSLPAPPASPPPSPGSPGGACPAVDGYSFMQGVTFSDSIFIGGRPPGGLSSAVAACSNLVQCIGFSSELVLADTDSTVLAPRNVSLGECQGFYARDAQRGPLSDSPPPSLPAIRPPQGRPAPPPDSNSTLANSGAGGFPSWAIGAIVGTVVGAALLLAAGVAAALVARRKRLRHRQRKLVVDDAPSPTSNVDIELGPDSERSTAVSVYKPSVMASKGPDVTMQDAYSMSADSFDIMGDECKSLMMDMMAKPQGAMCNFKELHAQLLTQSWRLQDGQLQMFEELGRGGTGSVYRAVWKGVPVAAKLMLLHEDVQGVAQRHMMEAVLSAALSHCNIVNTYLFDLKPLDGGGDGVAAATLQEAEAAAPWRATMMSKMWQLIIVQELCMGGTLRDLLSASAGVDGGDDGAGQPQLALPHLLQLALDVAQGLEHLHLKNIVHSDLTPSNILLQAAGSTPRPAGLHWVAKVADFGLSIAFEEGRTHVSHVFAGTLHYIAPETQASGVISKLSDVFTFGVLLSEMAGARLGAQEAHVQDAMALQAPPALTPPVSDAFSTSATSSAAMLSGAAAPVGTPPAATTSDRTAAATTSNNILGSQHQPSGDLPPTRLETGRTQEGNETDELGSGRDGGRDDGSERDGGARQDMSSLPPRLPRCIPPELAALVDGCLSPRPDQRPTIATVRESLTNLVAVYGGTAAHRGE